MGNTDSRIDSLFQNHLLKLADKADDGGADKSNQNSNIIPLFNENITVDYIASILYNDRDSHSINDLSQIDDLFNQFYCDFYNLSLNINKNIENTNNSNDDNTTNLNIPNSQLNSLINTNFDNYTNLIKLASLKLILLIKYFQKITNDSSPSIRITVMDHISISIKLLINLIPIYYQFLSKRSAKNIDDFLWIDSITNWRNPTFNTRKNEKIIDSTKIDEEMIIPIGQLLSNTIIQLCFLDGFTMIHHHNTNYNNSIYWENGIMNNSTSFLNQSPRIDLNRLDCIELLLTLSSSNLYSTRGNQENKFLNYFISLDSGKHSKNNIEPFENLMISIINYSCLHTTNYKKELINPYFNYNINNKLSQQKNLPKLKTNLIISSLQFINILMNYYLLNNNRETGLKTESKFITFFKNFLQNEFDLKFLLSSFAKIYKFPVEKAIENEFNLLSFNDNNNNKNDDTPSNNNNHYHQQQSNDKANPYVHGPNNNVTNNNTFSLPDIPKVLIPFLILIKNLIQINPLFENYFNDKFSNKFIIFAIYYIKFYDRIPEYSSNLIPLCYTITLSLTSQSLTLYKLLQTFTTNYYTNKLPSFFKISNLSNINNLTYRDFVIIQLSNFSIKQIKKNLIPNKFIFEIIYNILPINDNIIKIDKKNSLTPLSSINHHQHTKANDSNRSTTTNTTNTNRLSYNTTITLLNLLSKMSVRSYLSSFASNQVYVNGEEYFDSIQSLSSPAWKLNELALLLRTILNYILFYFDESKNLLFLLARHQNLLIQIKDSLNYINKIISDSNINLTSNFNNNNNRSISSNKAFDYLFINYNKLLTLKNSDYLLKNDYLHYKNNSLDNFGNNSNSDSSNNDNDDTNNNSNENLNNNSSNNLVFNKEFKDYYSDDDDVNESIRDINMNNCEPNGSYGSFDDYNNNNNNMNGNSNDSNKKKIQIYEHSDYKYDLFFDNEYIYTKFNTKWPIGLNSHSKMKNIKNINDISMAWTGKESLFLLNKIIKLVIMEFPNIPKVNKNSEFNLLLMKFDIFHDKFMKKMNKILPLYLKEIEYPNKIKFPSSDIYSDQYLYEEWIYKQCWTNIFNTHSSPYIKNIESKIIESTNDNLNNNRKKNSTTSMGSNIPTSSPGLPNIEKWTSNTSTLTRTQSNNSSIFNYFSNQEVPNSPSNNNSSNNNGLSTTNTNSSVSSSPSFFRFSWTGFNKNENNTEDSIQEEGENDKIIKEREDLSAYYNTSNLNLTNGALDSNIWSNTNIKLFRVKKDEKEEKSFFDMTSSLLRKFKITASNSNSGSTDSFHSNYSNHNTSPSGKPTMVHKRLY